MSSGWTQTKIVLGGLVDLLACGKCKKTPGLPMRYATCGHFFCDTCIFGQETCFQCHVPITPNEIQPDRMVANVLEYCNVIINVITKNNSEDLKSLARAVHQFSAECNGIVPETDSDSGDDIVASTPPGKRSRKRNHDGENKAVIENTHPPLSKELCQQESINKDLESETRGFVSPTQFSPRQRKKHVLLETAGVSDQSEWSSSQRGKNLEPETKGFVSPTQFSPHRKKNVQPETKGFVSPTQVSPHRKKNVQPETKGFVSPTQFSPHRKKNVQPETKGFVDATQIDPHNGKTNVETETARILDQIECSPSQREKNVNPETKGFVSPTQFSPHCHKLNPQPETVGFVDPTQFSPRGRKTDATTTELETAGFVDPTQFSPHQRKQKLQPKPLIPVDPINRNKNRIEQELEAETIGYLDKTLTPPGRKKKGLAIIKTRKFSAHNLFTQDKNKKSVVESPETDQSQFVDKMSLHKRNMIDSKVETPPRDNVLVKKHENFAIKATVLESSDFVDPTQFEKSEAAKVQPETEGYRDPSQPPLRSEKNKVSKTLDTQSIGQRSENIDTETKDYDSSEEIDWMEGRARKNLHESNNDLMLAPESVDVDKTLRGSSTIPETYQNTENVTNYHNISMEIEHDIVEKSILSDHSLAGISEEKIPNADSNKRTISRVHEDSMENSDIGQESPVHQFKRIKSLALSRQTKIRELLTEDFDSSMVTSEAKQKSSYEKDEIHENIPLDRFEKSPSVSNSISSASEENIDGKIEETDEETPSKRPRRTRSALSKEEPKRSSTRSTIVPEILEREKIVTRRRSTKESSQEKWNSGEHQEIESHVVEGSTKSSETRRVSTLRLKNREDLNKENLDEASEQNVKNKSVDPKARRNVDKVKTAVPKSIPKNVNKRNAKGETLLHTACVKGQEDYVKILLEAGANPNTKDNANWTPLQEAVNLGHLEICKMLLQAGASANTPAMDNRTALHEAAANDKFKEATLLLQYNANTNVYDKFGKRPIDYAVSSEMQALLRGSNEPAKVDEIDECGDAALDQSIIIPNSKVVVLPSNLNNQNRKLLAQLASKLKVEVATTFRPTVTHVIVETNDRNITELTYNVMLAILQGKWILNSQWITISSDLNDISEIDLEMFEVRGAPNPGTPTRARTNEEKQNPRLFNNCYFYFAIGPRCTWSYEKFEFTKESLTTLVLGGQGEILHREPDPEDVKDYKLTPFHVAHKPIHPLYKCSHYIIYMPGKDEPRVKYNMPHIKSLPVGWFLECIEKFTLVDPALMGIS